MIDIKSALYKLYKRLIRSDNVQGIVIPGSDVYYVREAIHERTGEWYTPEHIWISLWLEGFVPPDEIEEIPEWYVNAYMGGIIPDFEVLKLEVICRYNAKQQQKCIDKSV